MMSSDFEPPLRPFIISALVTYGLICMGIGSGLTIIVGRWM